jgi:uncharacterized membrane protein
VIAEDHSFEMVPVGDINSTIAQNGTHLFTINVNNSGNVLNEIELSKKASPNYWTVVFKRSDQAASYYSENYVLQLNSSENVTVDVLVTTPDSAVIGNNESVVIVGDSINSSVSHSITFTLTVVDPVSSSALGVSSLLEQAEVPRERPVDPELVGVKEPEFVRTF